VIRAEQMEKPAIFVRAQQVADTIGNGETTESNFSKSIHSAWIHYLCTLKEVNSISATRVDHIEPHGGNEELFWRESNHQSLCESCHNRKTAIFDGGFGRLKKNAS
jgi:5-methylcytosine-specific restriction endonuclease McrA